MNLTICRNHIRDFLNSVQVFRENGKNKLKAIQGHQIIISVNTIRKHLALNDQYKPALYELSDAHDTIKKMGYEGNTKS